MERGRTGRLVEEQVAAERFVGALPGQDDLDAQRLDVARQDVHRHRRPHLLPQACIGKGCMHDAIRKPRHICLELNLTGLQLVTQQGIGCKRT